MRVLVLGATGFIGPAVVRRLQAHGCEAIAASRSAEGDGSLRLDRSDPAAVAAAADALKPDAVIDLIAYTLEGTAPVLAALAGRTGRYVLASSGDVYRQYDLLHRKASGPAVERVSEDSPLRTRPYPYRADGRRDPADPQAWMDDYDKIPIEQALTAQSDFAWTIARLPMVFGPGDRQRRFAWCLSAMLHHLPELRVDEAWAGWRSSYGYVDDVAEGLALAAVHPAAAGQVFNVGPAAWPTHLAWARELAGLIGWRGEIRLGSREELPEAGRALLDSLDLAVPFVIDAGRIRERLGYREVTPREAALHRTVEAEQARMAG